ARGHPDHARVVAGRYDAGHSAAATNDLYRLARDHPVEITACVTAELAKTNDLSHRAPLADCGVNWPAPACLSIRHRRCVANRSSTTSFRRAPSPARSAD